MNRIFLYGNVGKEPEVRILESGNKIAKFSLATSKYRKDEHGDKITETTWHNIVFWNKPAEIIEKYVKKGSSLIIEGEIRYRDYTDKEGNKKYFTEIIGNQLHLAGSKKEDELPKGKIHMDSLSDPNDLPIRAEDDESFFPE